jgi:hypothetical protein
VFWQPFRGLDGVNKWRNSPRFKWPYKPIGEVQICRISEKGAIYCLRFHTNRKEAFYGFFPRADEDREENRSPYRTYFTRFEHRRLTRDVTQMAIKQRNEW